MSNETEVREFPPTFRPLLPGNGQVSCPALVNGLTGRPLISLLSPGRSSGRQRGIVLSLRTSEFDMPKYTPHQPPAGSFRTKSRELSVALAMKDDLPALAE